MDLSVIIVNYNVKYFLEQCLHAVHKAAQKISAEIIVADNNSADGSARMIRERFPQVALISNSANLGFAKANNQAMAKASGRYILLLNPDTVVQEDTFSKCMAYMDHHPEAGCLGVKMIDGKGRYLPESKRALPTPLTAFYKIFGLAALFPRSRRFGKYHLGYLNRDDIQEVDVISGAFMFIRRTALEKTGNLDERFFMYGEDIDLSYRFKLAGYCNIYFPDTTIIHYKGESTRKSSINYVIVFYRAMIIFARKHFSKNTVRYYIFFIQLAIYIRAALSILTRFVKGIINPVVDSLFIFAGYYLFLPVWEYHHFGRYGSYPPAYLGIVVPVYIMIWLLCVFLATGYEKKVKLNDLIRGILAGSLMILLFYSLLPESLRFSRALILIGTCWAFISTITVRYLLSIVYKEGFSIEFFKKKKRIIIIGELNESNRVYSIIRQTHVIAELIGFVSPDDDTAQAGFMGQIGQIEDMVQIHQADELIFCAASISSRQIIETMLRFTDSGIEFKIAPPESMSVIGSNSNGTTGELYVLHANTLSRLLNKRKKRLFDLLLSMFFLAIWPLWLFFIRDTTGMFRNIFNVLIGLSSWVGYSPSKGGSRPALPRIKPGVLTPGDLYKSGGTGGKTDDQMDLLYAKDYRILHDLRIIIKGFRYLGRKPLIITDNGSGTDIIKYGPI
jgi:GT2 family glycosyltransferase